MYTGWIRITNYSGDLNTKLVSSVFKWSKSPVFKCHLSGGEPDLLNDRQMDAVISIDLFRAQIVRFRTMEYIRPLYCFLMLSNCDVYSGYACHAKSVPLR